MPELDVTADNDAEIFIMDQTLSRVARAVGSFRGELEPGLYKIRVSRAGTYKDQVIELGGKAEGFNMSIAEFSAIAPIESNLPDMNPVERLAGAALRDRPNASILVLAHGSHESVDQQRPFGGASIFPWSDSEQEVSLDEGQRSAQAGGQLWSAIAIRANPVDGPFVLELRNGSWVSRQAVLLIKGWQTRIFLRARNQTMSDQGSERGEPDAAPFDISIQMAKLTAPVVYRKDEATIEVARSALERGRAIFNGETLIDELLDQKYENPVAGLTGLHLLLDAKARSDDGDAAYDVAHFRGGAQEIVDMVLVNLTRLLQPDRVAAAEAQASPGDDLDRILLHSDKDWPEPADLTALRLRAGRGHGQVLVRSPPMLRVSWDVLKKNASRDGLTWIGRELWNAMGAAGAAGPYLAWSPGPHSLERTLQRIVKQSGPFSVLTAPVPGSLWKEAATSSEPEAGGLASIIDGTAGAEVQLKLSANFGIPLSVFQDTPESPQPREGGRDHTTSEVGSEYQPYTVMPAKKEAALAHVEDEIEAEATPGDYSDRVGYRADFLGSNQLEIPLPRIIGDVANILFFSWNGQWGSELRYEHFSIVMNKSRRMCFFSAANIDGALAKMTGRANWRWDPRIPRDKQIMNECYGDSPRFNRGQMTRRVDPAWGNYEEAERGNEDSMHVTNAAPQTHSFDASIWSALEDYLLDKARADMKRISIFTGPYFEADDPVMFGIGIPRRFWKVITFIPERTGKLSAVGFETGQVIEGDQQDGLEFGSSRSSNPTGTFQVPIEMIGLASGIDFGHLSNLDPLSEETGGTDSGHISDLSRIQFVG
ncbi:DNA/RNA non-specific endonuclease [Rhizobium leguminosarum]|uniref:DNA/RNA non-specific endonuclease n=1 Tax=Rhizobium leguminosarum TaxID=384 RepID=UPI003F9BC45B